MYVCPKEASTRLKVSEQALRSWSNDGKIKYFTTKGGHRRYLISEDTVGSHKPEKVIYTRVSSRKQKGDLDRQTEFLAAKYPDHRVVSDIGSGINFNRKGFKKILEGVFKGTIGEVVVAKRDRFTRFAFELFEWIFKEHNAQLLSDSSDPEDSEGRSELSEDLMAIITVFSARYYGRRKYAVLQENKDISN